MRVYLSHRKAREKAELTFPSSLCTQTHADAYAQTPVPAFPNRRASHETCVGKLCRLLRGDAPQPSQRFRSFRYEKSNTCLVRVIEGVTVTANALQAALTIATASSRVRRSC